MIYLGVGGSICRMFLDVLFSVVPGFVPVFPQNKLVFSHSTLRLTRVCWEPKLPQAPLLANDRCSATSSILVRFNETDYVRERREGGTERTREIRIRDDFCLVKVLAQKGHRN